MRHRTPIPRTAPPSPAPLLGIACRCARIGDNVQSHFLLAGSELEAREKTPRPRLFVENDLGPASTRCSSGATNLDDLTFVYARAAPSSEGHGCVRASGQRAPRLASGGPRSGEGPRLAERPPRRRMPLGLRPMCMIRAAERARCSHTWHWRVSMRARHCNLGTSVSASLCRSCGYEVLRVNRSETGEIASRACQCERSLHTCDECARVILGGVIMRNSGCVARLSIRLIIFRRTVAW